MSYRTSRRNGSSMTDRDRKNDPLYLFDEEGFPKDFTPPEGFDPDTYFESQGYGVSKTKKYGDPDAPQASDYYSGYEEKAGEQVIRGESEIKVAALKDGRMHYLPSLIIGFLALMIALGSLSINIAEHIADRSFIAVSSCAEGTVTGINRIRTRSLLLTHYYIHYQFTADDGKVYEGLDELSTTQKINLGYTNRGDKVIVYYHSGEPEKSKLVANDYTSSLPGEIIMIIVGIFLLINGIVIFNGFRNGKYVVEEFCGRKKIRKLK